VIWSKTALSPEQKLDPATAQRGSFV